MADVPALSKHEIREAFRSELIYWWGTLEGACRAMPAAAREELESWALDRLGKESWQDWPEWQERYGLAPRPAFLGDGSVARQPIPPELRQMVFERDGHTCRQCGTGDRLSADHVIPWSKDGPTTLENLQTLCRSCNSRKCAR